MPRRHSLPIRPRPPLSRALVIALALANCAARKPSHTMPEVVQRVARIGATDRMKAIAQVEEYLADSPDPDVEPWAMIEAGEQRRLSGDLNAARRWFEVVSKRYANHPAQDVASLGLALLDADTSLSGNTLATIQLVGDRDVPDTMNADRYRILARLADDEGSSRPKVYTLANKAARYAKTDPVVAARVQGDLGDLIAQQSKLLPQPSQPLLSGEDQAVARAKAALAAGNLTEASRIAHEFATTWPDSAHAHEMAYVGRRADAGDPTHAGRVGVMLPSTGTYAPVGKRLRSVIDLVNAQYGDRLDLVWYDTAAPDADVVKGVESLVLDHGCVAILGPLLKEGAQPAARTAQALGVPMVSLTQSGTPTQAGPFVFRGFLPLSQQVDALLDHAMDVEGLKRFAILHPDTPYGQATRDLFAAGVAQRHGTVVRVVGYDPAATQFLKPAQELGQKDKTARADEWYRIRRDHRNDPDKSMLPPIIDFDAIFIPDNWQRVVLVASSLAYEEFPVGDFRPDRHAQRVPLLGLNGWNDPRIVESGGQYLHDAVFVDAFLNSSDTPASRRFMEAYRDAMGRKPGLVDAVTYDATRLLATAVLAGGDSRPAIRDELSQATLSDPVAGGARFGSDREVERQLQVLTINGGRIRPWRAPEQQLPPEGIEPPPDE